MSTNKCPSLVEKATTELDAGRAIRGDRYLSLGAHEGFMEGELFKLTLKGHVGFYQVDTGWGRECSRKKQARYSVKHRR